ncbi:MAG: hypothetical protein JSW27_18640 [Phycisphaerales bacterium]|nr:MAG: hypothetical protein JSW27_18640 [Phycisphaerales bacterium]
MRLGKGQNHLDGRDACEFVLRTAGPPSRPAISPDAMQLRADGRDICHIEFRLVDERGIRVPNAHWEVSFQVQGPGRIIGIENGDLNSLDDPQDHTSTGPITAKGWQSSKPSAGRERFV